MKKIILLALMFLPLGLLAQTSDDNPANEETTDPQVAQATTFIKAEAGDDRIVEVGKKVQFTAVGSTIEPKNLEITYEWDFGDGTTDTGLETTHTYEESGEYIATLTVTSQGIVKKSSDNFKVSAYNDLILFITDRPNSDPEFSRLQSRAQRQGVFIKIIKPVSDPNEFVAADKLAQQLQTAQTDLERAGIIILWTKNNFALSALAKINQVITKTGDQPKFKNKIIVAVTEKKFSAISPLGQTAFNVLRPNQVVITQEETISTIIDAKQADNLIDLIQKTNTKHLILGVHSRRITDGVNVFNFTSNVVNFMINKGVPLESLLLTLMLPVVVMIIALARQLIGIKTFGIYTPAILALSFVATGLKYGLAIFLLVLITGTLSRLLLKRTKLLHIPKVALVLTIVSIAILAMLAEGSLSSRTGLISVSLFPILIMITMVEKFVNVQVEKGTKTAIILSAETVFLSVVCYYVVNWQGLRMLILSFPELIFLTIIINLIVGKWTGLTIAEYLRFRDVIREIVLSKKTKSTS